MSGMHANARRALDMRTAGRKKDQDVVGPQDVPNNGVAPVRGHVDHLMAENDDLSYQEKEE